MVVDIVLRYRSTAPVEAVLVGPYRDDNNEGDSGFCLLLFSPIAWEGTTNNYWLVIAE